MTYVEVADGDTDGRVSGSLAICGSFDRLESSKLDL